MTNAILDHPKAPIARIGIEHLSFFRASSHFGGPVPPLVNMPVNLSGSNFCFASS